MKKHKPVQFLYIAGPYTNGGVNDNVRRAIEVGDTITKDMGLTVFIPHLCHLWDLVMPHGYEFWMKHDLAWISRCDGLLRIPGESKGADREVIEAVKLGLPVFHTLPEIAAYNLKGKRAKRG